MSDDPALSLSIDEIQDALDEIKQYLHALDEKIETIMERMNIE